ncbi:MAG TPA: ankyrin repeat domain-containing protein [Candidatus Ozemobacteraceae bacterium]|nr:ankyrin repeat domain-containing protein [Candidatus Ozemobacteraceae bacterium]
MIRLIKSGIKRLLGAEPADSAGVSEFFEALQRGREEAAMELYREGADIFRVTVDGGNALIYAAMGANNNLIRLLLEKGVKPDARTRQGRTAIIICCEKGNLEGLQLLLQYGATLTETVEEHEGYLIGRGIWGKNPDLISLLIKNGISTEYQSWENFTTPLTLVTHWGAMELAKTLLNGGANVNAMGKDGDNPLLAAHNRKNQEMIDLLLQHGADRQRMPGPCHICNQAFFSGSYQIGMSDFAYVDWHCSWCGRPTCSSCAGGVYGRSSDQEHKICKPCMTGSGLLREKIEAGLNTIWRWAHRRENIGKSKKTLKCPVCKKTFDLATAINTFPRCIHHDHICPACMPNTSKCPLCKPLSY